MLWIGCEGPPGPPVASKPVCLRFWHGWHILKVYQWLPRKRAQKFFFGPKLDIVVSKRTSMIIFILFNSRQCWDLSLERIFTKKVSWNPRPPWVPHLDVHPRHAGADRPHHVPGQDGLHGHQQAGGELPQITRILNCYNSTRISHFFLSKW